MQGIDCCSPLTYAKAENAKAAGFDFVGRYLVPSNLSKALTPQEAHAISAAGLGLLCVWELDASRALSGAAGGKEDGRIARQCAEYIGMPVDRGIIYFAVDFQAMGGQFAEIGNYLSAAMIEAAPYRIGVYGSYYTVEAMAKLKDICSGFWQCVAWSNNLVSPHTNVYQYAWDGSVEARAAAAKIGVNVDLNRCDDLNAAGIWRYEEDERMDINRMLEVMSNEQAARIVERAQEYFARMPLPGSWPAEEELDEAIKMGLTDGSKPMALASRLETAVMVKRAVSDVLAGESCETCENREDCADDEGGDCAECDVSKILDNVSEVG